MIHGIDVSAYQPETYNTAGLDFVIVKATEGLSYTNPRMTAQAKRARDAGLVVGYYHYPHMANDPIKEADYFLKKAPIQPGDIIVFDWEGYDVANKSVPKSRQLTYRDAWLKYVKGKMAGHRVGMYCNTDYWLNVDKTANCGDFLWIATGGRPAGQPGIQHPWTIHQYSTAGGIDHDVAAFPDKAALLAWANPAQPPKPPKPPAPAPKPKVSLQHIVYAAKRDPAAAQGHTSHRAEVLLVEKALKAEGLLASQYIDGSFGSKTIAAYAAWQRRTVPGPYDGIPGKASLSKLGAKHGFQVVA